ncbi:solute carrier family 12 member 6-like [Paramacrobiotus metropolitanus]|uniref:solute carrier family 12 member 6-like n=1 Tax=Paramacrobiotus metropolitanus TaxID=2943436 RepID=UPI0024463CFF|nr:solute carrier family 12 member 6-like [Paramacrobiotus metropolitanus]
MHEELAFPGMRVPSTFYNNTFNQYAVTRQYISHGAEKVFASPETPFYASQGYVIADITGSFTLLLSIFFPAVTGIMAGSNRSGDLSNVQRSIPLGTISAVIFTTCTYIVLVFCYAGSVNSLLLRDKYGLSIGGRLVSAEIAWPHPLVLLIGATMATIGAALQTLIGAPRLLLAIAKDGVIDFLRIFRVVSVNGEPRRALLVCLCLGELTILAGSIDLIAPILSQCSLICYLFVNLACALQSLIRHPSWRPRFRFYHWFLSLTGAVLAVAIMFISSWYYACIAIIMATIVYKYIDFRGAETEWGEGWNGLALSAAQYSLHRLEGQVIHTKNWRPQLLVFCRLDEDQNPVHPELFPFVSQLKAGRGLTMFASILEGDFIKCSDDVHLAKKSLRRMMETDNVKGFTEVLVADDTLTGMNHLIQTAGIGAMKHNTVVMCWPQNWNQNTEYKHWRIFLDTLRICHAAHCAFLVPKNISSFPKNCEKIRGCVDIWWIVHDGGLLMLLPFLMLKTKTWKHCKMRLFTVAQLEDNTVQIQKDLENFLYGLRINAEAHVVEMGSGDISAYTYERTLLMEQRVKLLKEMKLTKRESLKNNVQLIVDQSHAINITDFPVTAERARAQKKISINTHPLIISSNVAEALAEQSEEEALVDGISEDCSDISTVVVNGGASGSHLTEPETSESMDSFEREDSAEPGNSKNGKRYGSRVKLTSESERGISERFGGSRPLDGNVRRMHTAVTMNQVIRERSASAELVILNLPRPPKSHREPNEMNYMEFVEVLTDGMKRVLMVRGAGREVVTIYS